MLEGECPPNPHEYATCVSPVIYGSPALGVNRSYFSEPPASQHLAKLSGKIVPVLH